MRAFGTSVLVSLWAVACGGTPHRAASGANDGGGGNGGDSNAPVDGGNGGDSVAPVDGSDLVDSRSTTEGVRCAAESVASIRVAALAGGPNPFDDLGFSPYAVDGCSLVYVAPPAAGDSWGDLRLRNLASGVETTLAQASERPRRPTMAGDVVAWEAVASGKAIVRVATAGQTHTLAGPFDHAGEPRATNDAVVFTAWLSADDAGDTDVYLYELASFQVRPLATGPGQQRFADVSRTLVAVSDFSEDPTGTFSATTHRDADIVVFDRPTLAKTVRHLPGKQAFPMLGGATRLSYLDWGLVTPEPKFSAYTVRVGEVNGRPASDANVKGTGQVLVNRPYVRPSVRGEWVEWVDESSGGGGLFRCPLDLSQPVTSTLGGYSLLGPAVGRPLTIVATPDNGFAQLRAVIR